ncbi:hypothetical protein SAMN05216338_10747 [Bradyrhizobium sp. Rc2d]|nr:hypothetical protein SAMN05216338_10747 [Bradyrhizobium sp. Rc2d]
MKRREFIAGTAALLISQRRLRAQGTRHRLGFLLSAMGAGHLVRSGLRPFEWNPTMLC